MFVEVPLHITGFWSPYYFPDPLRTGSVGAGILLRPGLVAKVGPGQGLYLNGVDLTDLVSELYADGSVKVLASAPVSIGVGYGVSAAVSLATAIGIAVQRRRTLLWAAQRAHVHEVTKRTGLGDVVAQYAGGCIDIRLSPGAPGTAHVDRIPCPNVPVLTVDLQRRPTPSMLQELHDRITMYGQKTMEMFVERPTFEDFLHLSNYFSRKVGFLTDRIEEVIKRVKGVIGYYVKKGVLVIAVEREWKSDVEYVAARLGPVHALEPTSSGLVVRGE